MTTISIEKNGKEISTIIPNGVVTDLEQCDKILVFVEIMKELIEEAKKVATPRILEAGGSHHFTKVEATTVKKIKWDEISKKLGASDKMIKEYTTEIYRKEYLKSKNTIEF